MNFVLSTAIGFPYPFLSLCTVLISLSASGCCQLSRLTSFSDPDFPSPHYTSIVVYAPLSDLELRYYFENDLTQALSKYGIAARQGSTIISPTRDWTNESVVKAMESSGSNAYLLISVMGVSVQEQYVPPKTETTVSQEITERKGGKKDTSNVVTTNTTDGYVQQNTTTSLRLELIDINSGKRAWIATTKLPPNYPKCRKEFAENIVKHLYQDRMVR